MKLLERLTSKMTEAGKDAENNQMKLLQYIKYKRKGGNQYTSYSMKIAKC